MREQIKNIINEAGQQIAFKCFQSVRGQIDLVKADAIAEEYAEKVELAAAPCKNKVEELEYQVRELSVERASIEAVAATLRVQIEKMEAKEADIKRLSFFGKILWVFGR